MIIINHNFFKKYDVALSFAEENRTSVDLVAKLLKEQGIKVFYDDDLRIESWGSYLEKYLDRAYRLQAKFCVVFVSKDYELKRWTNFELTRAQARSFFQKNKSYVLPYLLDDSSFTEQFLNVGCLTYKTHDEYSLVKAIKKKVDANKTILNKTIPRLQRFFLSKSGRISTLFTAICALAFLFSDKITPVDVLTKKIRERSKEKYHCAVCKDGTISYSEGQGTCSHHGGVAFYIDSTMYHKSFEQSMKEAKETTILPP
jgi:hypothetical protein